ncbi:hypothetical protein JTE90_025546 [Oedothorax gibbosus]|uniref:SOCS box domain-containing protein n=1 Tax=Oedothorax gibbosus TaxID=931172 RepID=A0AAV6TWR3_9ARAC|nr:hypothetical protein JTE90_025546 [Oedothorax gibbosus]
MDNAARPDGELPSPPSLCSVAALKVCHCINDYDQIVDLPLPQTLIRYLRAFWARYYDQYIEGNHVYWPNEWIWELDNDENSIDALLDPVPSTDIGPIREFLTSFEGALADGDGSGGQRLGEAVDSFSRPDTEQIRRVYLEEVIPRIHFGPGREKRRLVSDVIAPRDPAEIRNIVAWLRSSVAGFSGHLFAFSVHDGNHVHVLHDCAFSNGTCRCQWRQQSRVAASIRRRLGRKSVFVGNIGTSSWSSLLTYYLFQAGVQGAALFIGGQESKVPDAPAAVRNDRPGHTDELVEAQIVGDGCGVRGEQSSTKDHQPDREPLLEGPKAKRSRFGKMCQKTQVLLKKYYPVPCESIRTLLSPQSSEFDIDFFDPTKDKVVAASIEVFKQEILNLNLRDFFILLEGKQPAFYANNADPFVYYLDRTQSYDIVMKLLNFQFRGDEDEIRYVLGNVCRWFDRGDCLFSLALEKTFSNSFFTPSDDAGAHTNKIDGMWGALKQGLPVSKAKNSLDYLAEEVVDVNAVDLDGNNALVHAVKKPDQKTIRDLLRMAMDRHNLVVMKYLIERGPIKKRLSAATLSYSHQGKH